MDQAAAEAILQRMLMVTEDQTRMLRALWEGGDAEVRKRAWEHGKQALKAEHGEHVYEEANDAVTRWVRDYATGRIGMYSNVMDFSFLDQNRLQFRIEAAPPILDALLASLVGDSLPAHESAELLAPWSAIIGALDAATDEEPSPLSDDAPATDTRGDSHP